MLDRCHGVSDFVPAPGRTRRCGRTVEPLRLLEVAHLEVAEGEVVQALAATRGLGAVQICAATA